MNNENIDHQHNAVLAKEERAKERREAKAEASEEKFKKTIAALFKTDEVKKVVAKEIEGAAEDKGRIDRLVSGSREGTFRGYDDHEIITGLEDRPWEE